MITIMADIGFLGFLVFLILGIIHKVRHKTFKPYTKPLLICLALFIVGIIFTPSNDSSTSPSNKKADHPSTTASTKAKKETKKKPKKIYNITLTSKSYSKSNDAITLKGTSNLPDGTDVFFAIQNVKATRSDDYATVPDDAKIKDGNFTVTLGDYKDPTDGDEYVENGTYHILASVSYKGNESVGIGDYKAIKDKVAFKNGEIQKAEKVGSLKILI